MFKGFSDKTQPFFWDLSFNNERPWFQEHKQQFEDYVNTPFKELARETYDRYSLEVPDLGTMLHISRIYRDARRLHGQPPYKDHLWFTIKNRANGYNGPAFFFEINPREALYGLGFYCKSAEMELFRKSIDANPSRFERLAAEVENMSGFSVNGPEYKRKKGDYSDTVEAWYNRKYVNVESYIDYDALVGCDNLPDLLCRDFVRLTPMYEYLNQFCLEYL